MDCSNVRPLLSHHLSGRLDEARTSEVARHLDGCPGCRQLALVEGALDGALATLPRGAAPSRLLARLEGLVMDRDAQAGAPTRTPSPPPRLPLLPRPDDRPRGTEQRERARASTWTAAFVSACAAAALVLVVARTSAPSSTLSRGPDLVAEAVNDHLRVVASTHPIEIESGGIHQVKPWFTGRIDFAPRVTFSGDDDFPLRGGSVGYFIDRKAAVFLFQRRLHSITLLVFPPDGLAWPSATGAPVGRLSLTQTTSRGFSVLLWRDGGLAYVLVSDVNVHELVTLATKLND